VSTESIASPSHPTGDTYPCASCGAPLADDQRYCLGCGERRAPVSSSLLGGSPPAGLYQAAPAGAMPPDPPPPTHGGGRSTTLTVIAGVGVLLLAMGIGVLIGRSAGSRQTAAAPQAISVAGTPTAPASTATEASFSDDWPSGTSGYTVGLQTLPQPGTKVSDVEAAKAAASAKGATGVGALKSEDFSSLKAGNYVIYSGVYHRRSDAEKALRGLKKSFPAASVVSVSSKGARSSSAGSETPSGGSGVGQSYSHPAPPSVVENLHKTKGQSFEQKSKNLPNVVSTG
jgi:hypothetical protein